MSIQSNKTLVRQFISEVWNNGHLELLEEFLHESFRDDSLPDGFPPDQTGLRSWIQNTSRSFEHFTEIESILAEEELVAISIRFNVKHIGIWRGMAPTGKSVSVKGFRFFQVREGKITRHWALIDGNSLQAQLSEHVSGCALAVK